MVINIGTDLLGYGITLKWDDARAAPEVDGNDEIVERVNELLTIKKRKVNQESQSDFHINI